MRKLFDTALSVTAGILIFSIGTAIWLLPSSDFSEEENRALATISLPRLSDIADGSFSEELGDFFRDRLPLRLEFIRLRTYTELLLLKGENNGVLFCRDGYLLDRGEYESLDRARESISEVNALTQYLESLDIPTAVAYVPRGIDVMESKLPALYRGNAKDALELLPTGAAFADLLAPLKAAADNGEYVWFRTDHHWTSHGAYIAYTKLSSVLSYTPYEKDFFTVQRVSQDFLGSIYSRAGCVAYSNDTIELYRYEGDGLYRVTIDGEEMTGGLYFPDRLDNKDKYAVFLGGNYAHLTIESTTGTDRPRLTIIKDSYANSLVPFLALHFDIELIDPRYYSSPEEYAPILKNAHRVLILQGVDTIAK